MFQFKKTNRVLQGELKFLKKKFPATDYGVEGHQNTNSSASFILGEFGTLCFRESTAHRVTEIVYTQHNTIQDS